MLNLKSNSNGFEIKGTEKLLLTGSKLSLGDLEVSSPGEYERGGVEIIYGQSASLIVWERLEIVYVFSGDKPSGFEKGQFSPCDILIIDGEATKMEKAQVNELLETYDPNMVVFRASHVPTGIDASKSEPVELLKLSAQTLPSEGREIVVLT
ncbi:hypothetical protein A3A71_03920 [Candidatus Berkelbacteria bacterium RIFCSPLOWO2_01_FULL_50_28]|uniref:Uncharacterized protein n=1 Tax=Candidatus Berkelbacteria bacterium RIFCSPLOWO2_01_FULL_50_28 TaxID=1797471 RepID=A0A1F5EAF4_9BACT|nr:MAG: hypothetical protein A3F39_01285 [Candidatus Berkelbacteria bacterium RIFCSPHIGHO2_12_FULL_50_11]OGD64290.1 MAG: hypothetical protein A3A71_03920 [Candidatus Berkelbacteria bacterium RIFCSPLOWO2_01_FULL_50_28]